MKSTGATAVAPTSSSRRSQPMRQARTNPSRRSTIPNNSRNPQRNGPGITSQPHQAVNQRFYPALASFTDSIDALPAEIIRNFTLLREVDAKACHPEDQLRRYIASVKALPTPTDPNEPDPALDFLRRQEDLKRQREEALMNNVNPPPETDIENSGEAVEQYPETRRSKLQQIRMVLQDLLPMLDEKIHVITVTAETLNKHNLRVDQAYSYARSEIPEVYRTGNPEHWGYKPNPPKGASARAAQVQAAIAAAANQAAQEEARMEYAASSNSRVESRREARRQAAQVGHDDEDSLQATASSKRPHGNSRAKNLKDVDATTQRVSEMPLGTISGVASAQPAKRRKPNVSGSTEKGAPEKTSNARGTTSPRAGTPTTGKRSTKGTATTAAATITSTIAATSTSTSATTGASGRRRQTAAPPNALSPSVASSPVHTTFPSNIPLRANGKESNGSVINSPVIQGPRPATASSGGRSRDKKEAPTKEGRKDGGAGDKEEPGEGKPTSSRAVAKGKATTAAEDGLVVDEEMQDVGNSGAGGVLDERLPDGAQDVGLMRNVPPLYSERRGSTTRGDIKITATPGSPIKESKTVRQGSPMEGVESTSSVSLSRKGAPTAADSAIEEAPIPSSKKTSSSSHHQTQPPPTPTTASTSSKRKRGSVDQAHSRNESSHGDAGYTDHHSQSSRGHQTSGPNSRSHQSHSSTHHHTGPTHQRRESQSSSTPVTSSHPTHHRRTSSTTTASAMREHLDSRPEPPPPPQNVPVAANPVDDEDDEDEPVDPNEPRYCFCNGVSYGQMVGCDDRDCAREWFHLNCVGLTHPPNKKVKWYCDECLAKRKHSKGRA